MCPILNYRLSGFRGAIYGVRNTGGETGLRKNSDSILDIPGQLSLEQMAKIYIIMSRD